VSNTIIFLTNYHPNMNRSRSWIHTYRLWIWPTKGFTTRWQWGL